MKKLLLLLLFISAANRTVQAQDFPFGTFRTEDMEMRSYAADPKAHALVLQEFGKTFISSGDGIPLIHEYHVKIKIFDSKAFNQGNIEIPLHKSDNDTFEKISEIDGITFYTTANGAVQKTQLDEKKIIRENKNKYLDVVKFAMPNLHDGCTIEYKYTITSPFRYNFRTWEFQSDIPKLSSEYEAHIPGIYNYNITLRGARKLDSNNSELEHDCFSYAGAKADCGKSNFIMKNVPAFEEEEYMTASKNFMSAVYFELNDYYNFSTGTKIKVTQDWKDIDYDLKKNDEFGVQMGKTSLFKDRLPAMLAGAVNETDKAQAVFSYIQKNIKYNHIGGIWSDNGVRKALDTHSGSVADINLALIAALNAAGIYTEAVLLSTRDHGNVNKLYPMIGDFNYVIAKANIGDRSYLLDASQAMLPFGLLPEHCINDQGRVVSMQKASYWIDMKATQSRGKTYILDLTLQSNGKLTGTMKNFSTGYEAYSKRKAIKKFNSVDEYVENLDEKMSKIKILKHEIQNLDSLSKPLSEIYEVEISAYDGLDASRIAFNPFFIEKVTENPFKLTERSFPVDMGAPTDSRFILTLHVPDQYTIENAPTDVGLRLPNQGGQFVTSYNSDANTYNFSHIIQLKNSIYRPEEYPYLKELFNKIIQAEKADIIFKKKS